MGDDAGWSDRPHRPLHVVEHWRPVRDGYATRSWELVRAQREHPRLTPAVVVSTRQGVHRGGPVGATALDGVPVDVVAPSRREQRVRRVRPWTVDGPHLTRAIVDAARRHDASLIHVHWSSTVGAAAADAADALGVPLVAEVRFDLASAALSRWFPVDVPVVDAVLRAHFERHLRRAAAVVVASDPLAPLVRRRLPAHVSVTVARNGVDVERFRPGDPSPSAFGVPADRVVIGTVTNLLRYEGVDRLLRALPPDAAGLVVGGGPELARLRADAPPAVVVHGAVPADQVVAAWRTMDVVVVPRHDVAVTRHASPIKVVEAMACGLPVVATAVGGPVDLLAAGRGVLVPPGDDGALREAVAGLVADPIRRRAIGAAARAYVEAEHTWRRTATAVAGCYDSLVPTTR